MTKKKLAPQIHVALRHGWMSRLQWLVLQQSQHGDYTNAQVDIVSAKFIEDEKNKLRPPLHWKGFACSLIPKHFVLRKENKCILEPRAS